MGSKNDMLAALIQNARGNLVKHKVNVDIFLNNPIGVAEHSDYIETMQKELDAIAHWEDQIHVLQKYFGAEKYFGDDC